MRDLAMGMLLERFRPPQLGSDAQIHIVLRPPFTPANIGSMEQVARQARLGYLNTMEMLRDHATRGTEYGVLVKAFDDMGQSPPAEVVACGVYLELSRPQYSNGALIEGFPLSVAEATLVQDTLRAKTLVELAASDGDLLVRAGARRRCPYARCGKLWGWHRKPAERPFLCTCKTMLAPELAKSPPEQEVQKFHARRSRLVEHLTATGVRHVEVDSGNEVTEDDLAAALLKAISPQTEEATEPPSHAN